MVLDGVCSAWTIYIYVIHTFNLTFHHLKYARISNTFYSHSGQDVLSQLLKQISVLKRFLCHTILVLLLTWCAAQATRQLNVNSNTCDVIASVSWDVRSMNLDPARPLLASSYNSSLKCTRHCWGSRLWPTIFIPSSWVIISLPYGILLTFLTRLLYFAKEYSGCSWATLRTVWLCGLMLASRWIRVGRTELSPGPNPCCVVSAWQLTCLPFLRMLCGFDIVLDSLICTISNPFRKIQYNEFVFNF